VKIETVERVNRNFVAEARRRVNLDELRHDEIDDAVNDAWVWLLAYSRADLDIDDCPNRFFRIVARRAIFRRRFKTSGGKFSPRVVEVPTLDTYFANALVVEHDGFREVDDRVTLASIFSAYVPRRRYAKTCGRADTHQNASSRRAHFIDFARHFVATKNATKVA
jgi:hypothetical protein